MNGASRPLPDRVGVDLDVQNAAVGSQQLFNTYQQLAPQVPPQQHANHQQSLQPSQEQEQLLPNHQSPQQHSYPAANNTSGPQHKVHSDTSAQQVLAALDAAAAPSHGSPAAAVGPFAGHKGQQDSDWLRDASSSAQPLPAAIMANAEAMAALEQAAADADAAIAAWQTETQNDTEYDDSLQLVVADGDILMQLAQQLNPSAVAAAYRQGSVAIADLKTVPVLMEDASWRIPDQPLQPAQFQSYSGLCAALRPVQLRGAQTNLRDHAKTAATRPDLGLLSWLQSVHAELSKLCTTPLTFRSRSRTPAGQRLKETVHTIGYLSDLLLMGIKYLQECQPDLEPTVPAPASPAASAAPAMPALLAHATARRRAWQGVRQAGPASVSAGTWAWFLEKAGIAADVRHVWQENCGPDRLLHQEEFLIADAATLTDLAKKCTPAVSQAAALMDRGFGRLHNLSLQLDEVPYAPGEPVQPAQLQSFLGLCAALSAVEEWFTAEELLQDAHIAASSPAYSEKHGLLFVLRSCAAQLRTMQAMDLTMPQACTDGPAHASDALKVIVRTIVHLSELLLAIHSLLRRDASEYESPGPTLHTQHNTLSMPACAHTSARGDGRAWPQYSSVDMTSNPRLAVDRSAVVGSTGMPPAPDHLAVPCTGSQPYAAGGAGSPARGRETLVPAGGAGLPGHTALGPYGKSGLLTPTKRPQSEHLVGSSALLASPAAAAGPLVCGNDDDSPACSLAKRRLGTAHAAPARSHSTAGNASQVEAGPAGAGSTAAAAAAGATGLLQHAQSSPAAVAGSSRCSTFLLHEPVTSTGQAAAADAMCLLQHVTVNSITAFTGDAVQHSSGGCLELESDLLQAMVQVHCPGLPAVLSLQPEAAAAVAVVHPRVVDDEAAPVYAQASTGAAAAEGDDHHDAEVDDGQGPTTLQLLTLSGLQRIVAGVSEPAFAAEDQLALHDALQEAATQEQPAAEHISSSASTQLVRVWLAGLALLQKRLCPGQDSSKLHVKFSDVDVQDPLKPAADVTRAVMQIVRLAKFVVIGHNVLSGALPVPGGLRKRRAGQPFLLPAATTTAPARAGAPAATGCGPLGTMPSAAAAASAGLASATTGQTERPAGGAGDASGAGAGAGAGVVTSGRPTGGRSYVASRGVHCNWGKHSQGSAAPATPPAADVPAAASVSRARLPFGYMLLDHSKPKSRQQPAAEEEEAGPAAADDDDVVRLMQ